MKHLIFVSEERTQFAFRNKTLNCTFGINVLRNETLPISFGIMILRNIVHLVIYPEKRYFGMKILRNNYMYPSGGRKYHRWEFARGPCSLSRKKLPLLANTNPNLQPPTPHQPRNPRSKPVTNHWLQSKDTTTCWKLGVHLRTSKIWEGPSLDEQNLPCENVKVNGSVVQKLGSWPPSWPPVVAPLLQSKEVSIICLPFLYILGGRHARVIRKHIE